MTISRTEDPVAVGAMLERIGTPDATTTADLVEHPGWHAWTWGGGVFVIVPEEPGLSEVHVYVYPSARGIHAIRAAAEVARAEREDGVTLIGRTPVDNRPARRFASLCGGRVVGVEDDQEVRVWEC